MKPFLILLLSFPAFLIAQNIDQPNDFAQDSIHISLDLINGPNTPINISTPVHGSFLIGKWVKNETDDSGKLEVSIPLDSAGLCQIWLNYLPWIGRSNCIQFFAKPGDEIRISIVKSKTLETPSFSGDNVAENELINAFERYTVDYYGQSKFLKSLMLNKDAIALSDTLRKMENKELKVLDAYNEKHDLNKPFLSILKEEIKYYHAHLFYIAWNVNGMAKEGEIDTPDAKPWNEELERLFMRTEINNPMALGSYRYNDYKNVTWPRYFENAMDKITVSSKEERDSLIYAEVSKNLSGLVKEQHLAYIIKSNALKNKFSATVQQQFLKFRLEYPDSPYLADLEVEFSEVLDFQKQDTKQLLDFEDEVILDWGELTKKYKGKVLYIDIWASWCGPCKKEFENHSSELEEFFQKSEIQRIYISIDNASKAAICSKIIGFYELEGDHYLANKQLQESIQKEVNNGKSFPIPRYLIVDTNGQLVEKNAYRPSSGKSLIDQLNQYLK